MSNPFHCGLQKQLDSACSPSRHVLSIFSSPERTQRDRDAQLAEVQGLLNNYFPVVKKTVVRLQGLTPNGGVRGIKGTVDMEEMCTALVQACGLRPRDESALATLAYRCLKADTRDAVCVDRFLQMCELQPVAKAKDSVKKPQRPQSARPVAADTHPHSAASQCSSGNHSLLHSSSASSSVGVNWHRYRADGPMDIQGAEGDGWSRTQCESIRARVPRATLRRDGGRGLRPGPATEVPSGALLTASAKRLRLSRGMQSTSHGTNWRRRSLKCSLLWK